MTSQRLSDPQLAAAAAVYTRAFMDDPISVWIAPDPAQRERGLPLYFRMAMQYALRFGGQVHRSDDAPRAVATWLEPGRSPPSTIGLLRTGFLRLLWSGGLSDARRLLTLGDTFDRLHKQDVTQAHWYLWLLAVDPPFQGKGLGGELAGARIARGGSRTIAVLPRDGARAERLVLPAVWLSHPAGRADGPRWPAILDHAAGARVMLQ